MKKILAIETLQHCQQWVVWKAKTKRGKTAKIPYTPQGYPASSTDSHTWATYDDCLAVLAHYSGLGFVFTEDDGLVGIDLDDCRNDDGEMAPWATAIIERLDTYTEISPSQHGVKLWLYGSVGVPKHGIHRRGSQVSATLKPPELEGGIECYSQRRFFTVTGNHYPGTPSTIETRDIRWLIAELVPDLSPTVRQSAPLVVPAPNTPSSRGHRVERYLEQACQGKLKDACSKRWWGER